MEKIPIVRNDYQRPFEFKQGMGKTTLARILAADLDHEGQIEMGHNVQIGYYAQHQPESLLVTHTVLEELENSSANAQQINLRSLLGAFLFQGDDINKKVKILSGGEKSRLALAELLMQPVNFLIMDEPTNHLDMLSKEVLKHAHALLKFEGTLIVVSHDRDFLHGLTNKVLEFSSNGIKTHLGDIKEFLEKKRIVDLKQIEKRSKQKATTAKQGSDNKIRYEKGKQFERDIRKARDRVKKSEVLIEDMEREITNMESLLEDKAEFEKLSRDSDFFSNYEDKKAALQKATSVWENAIEALNSLEKDYMAFKK